MSLAIVFFIVLPVVAGLTGLLVAGYQTTKENKEKRRRKLDDDPVDFDDWKIGSPNQPIPARAKAIDPWEATDRQSRH